jgi:hypothetical protein
MYFAEIKISAREIPKRQVKTHLSGISTLYKIQVAGLHRAGPSTSLDKQYFVL